MNVDGAPVEANNSFAVRWLCFVGAIVTASLIWLGGMWPSAFTVVALVALPSPLLFLVAVVQPAFIQNRRVLRIYLMACCLAAIACWIYEVAWLRRG